MRRQNNNDFVTNNGKYIENTKLSANNNHCSLTRGHDQKTNFNQNLMRADSQKKISFFDQGENVSCFYH